MAEGAWDKSAAIGASCAEGDSGQAGWLSGPGAVHRELVFPPGSATAQALRFLQFDSVLLQGLAGTCAVNGPR